MSGPLDEVNEVSPGLGMRRAEINPSPSVRRGPCIPGRVGGAGPSHLDPERSVSFFIAAIRATLPPGAAALDPRPERGGRWSRMSDLAMLQCVPCKGGTPPLRGPELDDLLARLGNDWRVVEQHHLEKEFRFKNFREALDFTNRVGDLAEEQGHHPDIYLAWGKVRLTVWTHKIDGLTESDFVFAAKSDRAL